MTSGALPLATH
jgi:hypothetical protein